MTKSEIISTVTDDPTTQPTFIDEYTANFTTFGVISINTTDLEFVNITTESSTSDFTTDASSLEILESPVSTTQDIFSGVERPIDTVTKEPITENNNIIEDVAISSTTEKDNLFDKNKISNEIDYSKDFNTITVKSQIEKVSLFGLIPSLSVVSGIAILIFLVTMGSIMFNHYRKIKRLAVKQDQVIKINPEDLGIHKFYGESTLPGKCKKRGLDWVIFSCSGEFWIIFCSVQQFLGNVPLVW